MISYNIDTPLSEIILRMDKEGDDLQQRTRQRTVTCCKIFQLIALSCLLVLMIAICTVSLIEHILKVRQDCYLIIEPLSKKMNEMNSGELVGVWAEDIYVIEDVSYEVARTCEIHYYQIARDRYIDAVYCQ